MDKNLANLYFRIILFHVHSFFENYIFMYGYSIYMILQVFLNANE